MKITKTTLEDYDFYKVSGKLATYEDFIEFKNVFEHTINDVIDEFPLDFDSTFSPHTGFSRPKKTRTTLRIYLTTPSVSLYFYGYLLRIMDANAINIELVVSTMRLFFELQEMDLLTRFAVKIKEEE